jgi:hypothetical protein
MPRTNYDLVQTFTIGRRTFGDTERSLEQLRHLGEDAKGHKVNLRINAGKPRLDLLAANEAVQLQRKYESLNVKSVAAAITAIKRGTSGDRDESKPNIGAYLHLPLERQVGFFQEGGDLVLGVPFVASAQKRISDEREIVSASLSAVARDNITLRDPEDGYYLNLGSSTKAGRSSAEALDAIEIATEKLLWPSDGTEAIVAVTGLFDAEVYEARALMPVAKKN